MLMLLNLLAVAAAYLIGSLSFAVIVSKFYGMADPRSYGSGNPGATNVLRSGKKKAAALTLLGDALKGLVAVLLARALQDTLGLSDATIAAVAVAVLVGHMWPVAVTSVSTLLAPVLTPTVCFVDFVDRVSQLAAAPIFQAVNGAAGFGNHGFVAFNHSGHLLALIRVNDKHDLIMTHVISLRFIKQPLAMRKAKGKVAKRKIIIAAAF